MKSGLLSGVGLAVIILYFGGVVGLWDFQLHVGEEVKCSPVAHVK